MYLMIRIVTVSGHRADNTKKSLYKEQTIKRQEHAGTTETL